MKTPQQRATVGILVYHLNSDIQLTCWKDCQGSRKSTTRASCYAPSLLFFLCFLSSNYNLVSQNEKTDLHPCNHTVKNLWDFTTFYDTNVMWNCIHDNPQRNYNTFFIILQYMYCNSLKYFLSALHRKLFFSVSFCVRKVNFSALVWENFKCAEN